MSSSRSKSPGSLTACACLFAVMLIYAAQGLIALWAGTGACCKSNYCPISEHHHHRNAPAPSEQHGMDCEHDMAGMAACSMSCCNETQQALSGPVVFVLHAPAKLPGLSIVARVSEKLTSKDILQDSKPLSPPPRFGVAA